VIVTTQLASSCKKCSYRWQ